MANNRFFGTGSDRSLVQTSVIGLLNSESDKVGKMEAVRGGEVYTHAAKTIDECKTKIRGILNQQHLQPQDTASTTIEPAESFSRNR